MEVNKSRTRPTRLSLTTNKATRRQIDLLVEHYGFTIREIVTLGIDHVFREYRVIDLKKKIKK